MPNTYVIKLGGSMVSPSTTCLFDFAYANNFRKALEQFTLLGDKFFVAVGGGSIMRQYRDLAMANGITDHNQLHWIGTTVNVLNAEVVRVSMGELADEGVYKYEDYYDNSILKINKSIKVGGGGRPGHSGDMDAILAALKLNTKVIISLKNVAAIYSADPKIDPQARPLEKLSWKEYLDIIGNPVEHMPGANFPIDPVASQIAIKNNLKFIVIAGLDIENLKKVLLGEKFIGTVVE